MQKTTVWEYIRVKFKPGTDPKGKRVKFSRPKRIYQITTKIIDKDNIETVTVEYAPVGIKGTAERIDQNDFILEWVHGPRPTPRPSAKYTDEQLKEWGYSDELIKKIRRNYSSKDVKLLCNRLKNDEGKRLSREEARELLDKHKGKRHEIFVMRFKELTESGKDPEMRKTIGRRIDGDWYTIIPGEKRPVSEFQRRRAQSLKNRNKLSTKLSKSKRKIQKRKHKGRF